MLPCLKLVYYCFPYAKSVLRELQTFRNEITIILIYKIVYNNGKIIKILTEKESLVIFYFKGKQQEGCVFV